MTNISDLKTVISATAASLFSVKSVISQIIANYVATAIIGVSTFYHFAALFAFHNVFLGQPEYRSYHNCGIIV